MTTYFYVSKIGGGKPTYRHLSFESAMTEAERLIDTVGGEYEILEIRATVKAAPKYVMQDYRTFVVPPRQFPANDECPF